MNNTKRIIACLYVSIVAVSAMEDTKVIVFDGTANPNGFINFDVTEQNGEVTITKAKINEGLLQKANNNVMLIIPGRANNKQVCIGEKAFADLNLGELRLSLKFEATADVITESKDPTYRDKKSMVRISKVQFPNDSGWMFSGSSVITKIDLSGVDSSNITKTDFMFGFCYNLQKVNFENFDTSNVTDMSGMFANCTNLPVLVLRSFNTKNVIDMHHMFQNCENLEGVDLSSFDTENVTSMSYMFDGCSNLQCIGKRLEVFAWDGITKDHMFDNCPLNQGLPKY